MSQFIIIRRTVSNDITSSLSCLFFSLYSLSVSHSSYHVPSLLHPPSFSSFTSHISPSLIPLNLICFLAYPTHSLSPFPHLYLIISPLQSPLLPSSPLSQIYKLALYETSTDQLLGMSAAELADSSTQLLRAQQRSSAALSSQVNKAMLFRGAFLLLFRLHSSD